MASASLSRSISSSPTNPDKFTVSMWIKKTGQGAEQVLLGNYSSSNFRGKLQFKSNDKLEYYQVNDGNVTAQIRTTRVFRDASGWYNLVVQFDTSQGTASDRIKIYINGTQETAFDLSSYPAQNLDMRPNQASTTLNIGQDGNSGNYLDGELAHVHLADGQTYAPTVFAETDATTGIWKPKTDPGISQANYGDDGFFLKFDNSANMGLDSSGNSNNFTTNGTIIQTKDTPSNVFATMNPLVKSGNTFSNANLTITSNSGTSYQNSVSTLAVTKGKWYAECKLSNVSGLYPGVGIIDASEKGAGNGDNEGYFGSSDNPKGIQLYCGGFYSTGNGNNVSLTSNSTNDIIGIALDLDSATKNIKMYRNGTLITGTSVTPPDPDGGYVFGVTMNQNAASGAAAQWNFGNGYFGTSAVASAENPDDGNGIFEYDVPAGYRALCTKSLNAEEYS